MLNENQLKLLRHLSRFNLLDYPSCLDMLNNDGGIDRTALHAAVESTRGLDASAYNDAQWADVQSALIKARAVYADKASAQQEINEADIAASFQKAVIDVLVEHAVHAAKEYRIDKFAIAGGVASNQTLREAMEKACKERGIQFYHPSPIFCTDNAAMIGSAAYYEYLQGRRDGWDLNAVPNLKLGER